ncbi:MAG TPA: condensation domain-containing protein, partial [Candidatus Sulfotelmatobacter sp.]|nr:condensation domain-containing protein [Candidatus Sulfotelmatobacter sp.]
MPPEVIEGFQLSPQQKHLWSLQQADGSLPYRAQCSILIEGTLDVQILGAALQRVFERHEILRTSFQSAPCANAPIQVVSAESMTRIDKYDLSDCDRARQEESIDRLYREMGDLAFDLSKGPLIRMSLL